LPTDLGHINALAKQIKKTESEDNLYARVKKERMKIEKAIYKTKKL